MDVLLAPAKLNLILEVVSKRSDGYHDIESLFARISLYDVLHIHVLPSNQMDIRVRFRYQDISPEENSVYRAIELFSLRSGLKLKATIDVHKYIPSGAGLGGGASDAAIVLRYLNQKFPFFSQTELFEIGMEIGSDVGFFMSDSVHALVKGRGELVHPIYHFPRFRLVVFYPRIFISTTRVYEALKLTDRTVNVNISNLKDNFSALWFNRLQEVVEDIFPEYKIMMRDATNFFSKRVIMTGSGSAFFTLWDPNLDWKKIYFFARKYNCYVWCVETV